MQRNANQVMLKAKKSQRKHHRQTKIMHFYLFSSGWERSYKQNNRQSAITGNHTSRWIAHTQRNPSNGSTECHHLQPNEKLLRFFFILFVRFLFHKNQSHWSAMIKDERHSERKKNGSEKCTLKSLICSSLWCTHVCHFWVQKVRYIRFRHHRHEKNCEKQSHNFAFFIINYALAIATQHLNPKTFKRERLFTFLLFQSIRRIYFLLLLLRLWRTPRHTHTRSWVISEKELDRTQRRTNKLPFGHINV